MKEHRKQIVQLDEEIRRIINRFRMEYDLGVAEVVGVLQCQAFEVMYNAKDNDEE
jgi:hypothetical protein